MHFCTERNIGRRLASPVDKIWSAKILKVQFIDASRKNQKLVMKFAPEWEQYANIKFEFTVLPGVIRISCRKNHGSWSYVGTDALYIDNRSPTMNLGWLDESTEEEARRVILHEFGHALGMIHEHKSPASSIPWNKEKVYEYYSGPPNFWDRETVDVNLFDRYEGEMTNSVYDPHSIMHYPIPNELTIGDYSVGWNDELSDIDKEFIVELYP